MNIDLSISNKKILIFGGTGSLGYKLNESLSTNNIIYNYSRDENKHWKMKIFFNNHKNIKFIIGNSINKDRVENTLQRIKPNIIIIASAMKHIEQCELNTSESINNNLLGTQNILNCIESNIDILNNLETVVFVSSDKDNPINNYGMCKAISETLMIEKAHYIPNIKFITVRYGNVLNSSGSIIQVLHTLGKNNEIKSFNLTHKDMTRFIMTLEQSVNLILYAINYGSTGDIIIPNLVSMKIYDLIEIFADKYNKTIKITGLRPGEKLMESLINHTQSARVIEKYNHYHIKSVINFNDEIIYKKLIDYNSTINPLDKIKLKNYLINLELL